jgi:hypothetical protein
MLKEAGVISTVYAVNIGLLSEKRQAYESALADEFYSRVSLIHLT